jgi:maltose alpha-D-glucosyltransferase/alpha-amylase
MSNEEDTLWYKDAIIYELHVKAFCDGNGDGVGDFRGLISRLDYLQELGVNTLWLLPFYPSPMRDDGYDISDYHNVDPAFGGMDDFHEFIREAHGRGLRVITELVINHTSDRHPWFQAARLAPPGSVKRDYYVWSDSDERLAGTRIIFSDTEKSNWAWDEAAQAYYWHRFFSHQPDLNYGNPHVFKAMMHAMRFWFPTCACERAPATRTCRRRMPWSGACARNWTVIMRTACSSRRPTSGRRTCASISPTATSATWPTTSR